jgi:hypothetical protein
MPLRSTPTSIDKAHDYESINSLFLCTPDLFGYRGSPRRENPAPATSPSAAEITAAESYCAPFDLESTTTIYGKFRLPGGECYEVQNRCMLGYVSTWGGIRSNGC